MLPYRVAFPTTISDRWLARGRGVTTVEGLPFYRRGDGGDATSLLPAHAFGALGVRDALQAPWYGDRAGGGVVDARLFDRADAVRATNRDAALALGRDPVVLCGDVLGSPTACGGCSPRAPPARSARERDASSRWSATRPARTTPARARTCARRRARSTSARAST